MSASLRKSTVSYGRGLSALPGLFSRVVDALALRGQQRALSRLDDHLLCDIGVTRAQALKEAARPFWDAPSNWRG